MGDIRLQLGAEHARELGELSVRLSSPFCPNCVSMTLVGTDVGVDSAHMNEHAQDVVGHLDAWETYLRNDQHSDVEIRKKLATVREAFRLMDWRAVEDVDRPAVMLYRTRIGMGSTKTVANKLNRLRKFFEYCELCGVVATNPVAGVRAPRVIHGEGVRAFTEQEVRRIIDFTPVPRKHQYAVLATTGLRKNEAAGLLWEHVDTTGHMQITLPSSLAKSRRQEHIPLSSASMPPLLALKHPAALGKDPVFGPLDDKTLRRDIQRAGLPVVDMRGLSSGFHSFRKHYATMLANAGVAPMMIRQLMRHSSITTTEKSYIDPDQLQARNALHRAVGGPFDKKSADSMESHLTGARDTADTPPDPARGQAGASAGKRRGGDSNPRGRLESPKPRPVPNAFPNGPSRDPVREAVALLAAQIAQELRRYQDEDGFG